MQCVVCGDRPETESRLEREVANDTEARAGARWKITATGRDRARATRTDDRPRRAAREASSRRGVDNFADRLLERANSRRRGGTIK